jgi:hypothetical protein
MQPVMVQEYNHETLMLWFDPSKDPITTKIELAARFFLAKHMVNANYAEIRPEDKLEGQDEFSVDGIRVRVVANRKLQPNHLYIGRIS